MVSEMKRCANCEQEKDESEFYKTVGRKYSSSYCKPCQRKRFKNTPEKNKTYHQNWKAEHPASYQLYKLRMMYRKYEGMELETFVEMACAQDNKCAICGGSPEDRHRDKLCVDHCHKTGRVRKLLCSTCNNGLGCFKDNEELLMKACNYLMAHKETV